MSVIIRTEKKKEWRQKRCQETGGGGEGALNFFTTFETVPLVEFMFRRLRSLLLCPLSVERYYFPVFVTSWGVSVTSNVDLGLSALDCLPHDQLPPDHSPQD